MLPAAVGTPAPVVPGGPPAAAATSSAPPLAASAVSDRDVSAGRKRMVPAVETGGGEEWRGAEEVGGERGMWTLPVVPVPQEGASGQG